MPKEIQDLITPESRTDANEFETMDMALLAGLKWNKTKGFDKIKAYHSSIFSK